MYNLEMISTSCVAAAITSQSLFEQPRLLITDLPLLIARSQSITPPGRLFCCSTERKGRSLTFFLMDVIKIHQNIHPLFAAQTFDFFFVIQGLREFYICDYVQACRKRGGDSYSPDPKTNYKTTYIQLSYLTLNDAGFLEAFFSEK